MNDKTFLDPDDRLRAGVNLATRLHTGQKDKLGVDYVAHVLHVTSLVQRMTPDADVAVIALLHDSIEDTGLTATEILRDFGPRVAAGVVAMTREAGEDYFRQYLPRVLDNPDARLVKLADSRHNRGKCHLLALTDAETALRLEAKYARVISLLAGQEEGPVPLRLLDGRWTEA